MAKEKGIRGAVNRFFERHEAAWEIFMIFLALVYIIIAFLPDWVNLSPGALRILEFLDWTITITFVLEFAVRLWAADSRWSYVKEHWLDLLAVVPVLRWLRLARLARVLRVLRVLRVARILDSLDDLGVNFARFASVNGVHWIVLVLTSIMVAGSAVIYLTETDVNQRISNYGDAFFVSFLTWLGPGFEQMSPVTVVGKITAVVLVVAGIATWGILISNLAAFLTVRARSPDVRSARERLLKLDELNEAELVDLRDDIAEITERRLETHRRGKPSKSGK